MTSAVSEPEFTFQHARGFEFNSDKKNDLAFIIEHQKKELFFIVKF